MFWVRYRNKAPGSWMETTRRETFEKNSLWVVKSKDNGDLFLQFQGDFHKSTKNPFRLVSGEFYLKDSKRLIARTLRVMQAASDFRTIVYHLIVWPWWDSSWPKPSLRVISLAVFTWFRTLWFLPLHPTSFADERKSIRHHWKCQAVVTTTFNSIQKNYIKTDLRNELAVSKHWGAYVE